jgi:hypothetical protein
MARFRIGVLTSLVMDDEYVIHKKHWWGWSNWRIYAYLSDAIDEARELEHKGHTVEWNVAYD